MFESEGAATVSRRRIPGWLTRWRVHEKTTLETDAAENKKKAEAAAGKAELPPAAPAANPAAPVKLNTDELPQELKIFELEDTDKK